MLFFMILSLTDLIHISLFLMVAVIARLSKHKKKFCVLLTLNTFFMLQRQTNNEPHSDQQQFFCCSPLFLMMFLLVCKFTQKGVFL